MYKTGLAILLAASATAGQAAVEIDFNNPTGVLGTSQSYSNSGLTVTAYGFAGDGTPIDLYGKSIPSLLDEQGVGVVTDPTGANEIWNSFSGFGGYIVLDVSQLLASNVTAAQFTMGSTTGTEGWRVWDNAGGSFAAALQGNTELTWNNLPDWGSATQYAFTADGPNQNVLLGALSLTAGVPEPSTWAMMLLGFGAMGVALRRRRRSTARLAQIA